MKYPVNQFEVLVKVLTIFHKYFDLDSVGVLRLHSMVYNEFSEGQKHNRLVISEGILKRKFSLVDGELVENPGENILNFDYDFKSYPDGCNDSHIETAIKKAIKLITKK